MSGFNQGARIGYFLLVVSLILGAGPAGAGERPRLLVLDTAPSGVPAEIARSLNDLLELEIERGKLYEVLSQDNIRSMIQIEEQKILLGEDESSQRKLAEIGQKVDAPYLLSSSLGKVGKAYLLSLQLLDTKQIKVLHRISQTLIGEPEELVGSLRSAAVGITLQDKGVSPDISEQLIENLKIGEKPKNLFVTLSPAYEILIGEKTSEDAFVSFRPSFLHLRLEVEKPLWRWIRLFGSVSFGTTINESHLSSDNHVTAVRDLSGTQTAARIQGTQAALDYWAMRVPLFVGIKAVRETGQFLPYGLVGLGFALHAYQFYGASVNILKENTSAGTCNPPFVAYGSLCMIENQTLRPEEDQTVSNLTATGALGAEWLFGQHWGFKGEARYSLAYALKSEEDLRVVYAGQSDPYEITTTSGPQQRIDDYREVYAIQQLQQSLEFSVGMIAYW